MTATSNGSGFFVLWFPVTYLGANLLTLALKQEPAQRFIDNMESNRLPRVLPSFWQLGDKVSLTFPGNGLIKEARVIKVAFIQNHDLSYDADPLYDVDVPYQFYNGDYDPEGPDMSSTGHVRLHGLKEWHLRNPEMPVADRYPLPKNPE